MIGPRVDSTFCKHDEVLLITRIEYYEYPIIKDESGTWQLSVFDGSFSDGGDYITDDVRCEKCGATLPKADIPEWEEEY